MAELVLERDQRLELRAQAHHLQPVVRIGNQGVTEAVMKELERALNAHGLVKVHFASDDREERTTFYTEAADKLSAARIQQIGKMLVFWREPQETPEQKEKAERRARAEAMQAKKMEKKVARNRPGDKKKKAAPKKVIIKPHPKRNRTTKKAALS